MLPKPENYAIYPSVVPMDTEAQLQILATERTFLPSDGEEYTLKIISVHCDDNYYHPEKQVSKTLAPEGGVLSFSHTFSGEGEHLLLLSKNGKLLSELHVYSLAPDLYRLTPLKGDLHSHSHRSDGLQDPAALAGHYREMGYDFFALTDHNRYYPGGEIDETYREVKLGITRVFGEEVHSPGSVVHIVHIGGKESVAEQYADPARRPDYERQIAEYIARVPKGIPEAYRERYGKATWATDAIHAAGGIAILPHPFWKPGPLKGYHLPDELTRLFLRSGMFDAFEVIGGVEQPECNRQVALWGDLRAEGCDLPIVGSSDVHGLYKAFSFPHHFTVCFAEANENGAIVDAVKNGLSVAVEAIGEEYDRRYFCYGSLRLVSYAQFLLRYYFPKTERLAAGEGCAMRAYAMGETPAELVELAAEQTRRFRERYLGRLSPTPPSRELLDFEERWRKRHLDGPITKGSAVDSNTVTRQI